MKNLFSIMIVTGFLTVVHSYAQVGETFTANGNDILDPCGQVFVPRGINYSLLDDWNFPGNLNNGELSAQIIQANPNIVRIQWYADYGQPGRPSYSLRDLDSVISRFERAGIVSVMELHDLTGSMDYADFQSQLLSWWTQTGVVHLINKHKGHLFVNIANEFGPTLYPPPNYTLNPNYAAQLPDWVSHYKDAISTLRNAGIQVPLMIDAPNWGLDLDAVSAYGPELVNHDPLHNIIMSAHGYWADNAAQLDTRVQQMANAGFPVILGEIGNVDAACQGLADYTALLQSCQDDHIGWLAWTWNRDGCPTRNITENDLTPGSVTDGQFNTLTPYGDVIVNDPGFGLAGHAEKACLSEDTNGSNGIAAFRANRNLLLLSPNPANKILTLKINADLMQPAHISIWNLAGIETDSRTISANETGLILDVASWAPGIYFIRYTNGRQTAWAKVVKK